MIKIVFVIKDNEEDNEKINYLAIILLVGLCLFALPTQGFAVAGGHGGGTSSGRSSGRGSFGGRSYGAVILAVVLTAEILMGIMVQVQVLLVMSKRGFLH